jgi:hypothetical protein
MKCIRVVFSYMKFIDSSNEILVNIIRAELYDTVMTAACVYDAS